jgi:hypothetical protein
VQSQVDPTKKGMINQENFAQAVKIAGITKATPEQITWLFKDMDTVRFLANINLR